MLESKLWYIKTVLNNVKGTKMMRLIKLVPNFFTSLSIVTFLALS